MYKIIIYQRAHIVDDKCKGVMIGWYDGKMSRAHGLKRPGAHLSKRNLRVNNKSRCYNLGTPYSLIEQNITEIV